MTSNSLDELEQTELPTIQYSNVFSNEKGIHISPSGLLNETDKPKTPDVINADSDAIIYPTKDDLGFDIFSAIFYIVTRAEEYDPSEEKTDKHQRFESRHSIIQKLNSKRIPIVHKWLEELKVKLLKKYPDLIFPKRKYSFQLSCDIDMAWSFQNKGMIRNVGTMTKNTLRGNFKEVSDQIKVLLNYKKDPFDNFELLQSLVPDQRILYFILLGNYGKYDKNISPSNQKFKTLLQKLTAHHKLGIHPSYDSASNLQKIKSEKESLETILGKPIYQSRQHYLKIAWPETYRNLQAIGIQEDFSLGFFDDIGFRAGLCIPFSWYDLNSEVTTDLIIHPFQVMDVSLKEYLKLDPKSAFEQIKPIIEITKKYGGDFHLLWHNSSFNLSWSPWLDCLKQIIAAARKD